MTAARPALRVDRARIANARPGDRARLAHALAMASPAATGVAEHALLFVRRLRVDRPLGAGVEGFAGELIDRIRAAKTSARCGSLGSGESLYFEDEIALECAIVAAGLGAVPLPDVVRRAIPDSETPLLRWRRRILSDGRKLSRSIAALVDLDIAGPWLARFERSELRAAGRLLLQSYGGGGDLSEQIWDDRPVEPPAPASHRVARVPAAIAEAFALARMSTPERAARVMIAVALLAARRPELVATRALVDALATAFEAPISSPPPQPAIETILRVPAPRVREGAGPGQARRTLPRPGTTEARPRILARQASPPKSIHTDARRSVAERSDTADVASYGRVDALPTASAPIAVASDHAGLFFLLNIFLALGLYGDFTDPIGRVRGLSPFALLLLLARRWIGADFARDPLEPLLRRLAGLGAHERPARDFEAPPWQVPSDWLAPWPAARARTVRSRFGASHWHAAGFPIADQWHIERPGAWLRRRWMTCLARYIEARLARALGNDDRADAVAMLLRRPGTVQVEDGRIEVAFALDTHPLAIRLTGLDRDPGWIPVAGHAIGFRFA